MGWVMARGQAGRGAGTINFLKNRTSNDHNCTSSCCSVCRPVAPLQKRKKRKERKKDEEKWLLDLVIHNTIDTPHVVTFKTGKCARLKSR